LVTRDKARRDEPIARRGPKIRNKVDVAVRKWRAFGVAARDVEAANIVD